MSWLVNRIRGRRDSLDFNPLYQAALAEQTELTGADVIETTHADMVNPTIMDILKAYPVAMKNDNKVVLPKSILNEINEKRIWDNRPQDQPLIFCLSTADPDTQDILEETYVGIESFTAPNGKIGLPYKTALSLTKERGVGWLYDNPHISIRLVEVEKTPQSSMKVQPRGKGFFLEDESVVQLDIKQVLEHTLQDHLVLMAGDWIPLFWDGNRFELIVQDLQPNEVINCLNTDLTVEMLPSEETQQSIDEKEKAEARVATFMEYRQKRQEDLSERYANFKNGDRKDADSLTFRVRLPKGGQMTKTLKASDPLGVLIDLIDIELFKKEFLPMHLPPEGLMFFFNLIYSLPGRSKSEIDTNLNAMNSLAEVMAENDIKGKMIVLSLVMIKEEAKEEQEERKQQNQFVNNQWLRMADRLETCLQEAEAEKAQEEKIENMLPEEEIAEVKENLLALGTEEETAEKAARSYGKQVKELINMGYGERLPEVALLLITYKGDMQSVMTSLLG